MTLFMRLIGACGVALVGVSSPAFATTTNLLSNGDFESVDGRTDINGNNPLNGLASPPGGSWAVYSSLPGGWIASGGPGIEIQTNRTLGAIDSLDGFDGNPGEHYVELDSHHAADTNSGMEQSLLLEKGKYVFSFFYSPRTGNVGADDNLINWEILPGLGSDFISGPNPVGNPATEVGKWTKLTTFFELADQTNVTFRIFAGGKDNSLGGFVDNVSVSAVPVPAAFLMLASAFGLAGAVRRMSKTSA
ncbi:MAG: hypothetical protein AAGI51_02185 [Pseudomonadota bacterium]